MTKEQQETFNLMRGAIHTFNNSSVLLQDLIFGKLAPLVLEKGTSLMNTIISSVVLYAFSCELGLKALALKAEKEFPKKHDLMSLYENLPNEMQEGIKSQLETMFVESFDTLLERNKNAFTQWRYYYEPGDKTVDVTFLRRFALAIDTECAR